MNSSLFASPQKRNTILCLLLIVVTLALYNPVNQHPFVNYDDPGYVTDNAHVHAGLTWDTIKWAFTTTEQANWHPLTWISHALDYQLFHSNPAGHHFDNLLLHALSAVVLFLVLVYGTGRVGPSFFVAALFALHPINVESVAWISERKNVLSTLIFFLAIGAYGWYAAKPSWQRYLSVFVLFGLGLMAKPMVITLPCVLLLLDYWPLARVGKTSVAKLIVEKLPLFALAAGSALMTMSAQQAGGAMRSTVQFSLSTRLANAIVAYAMYLWKMIWPIRLAPMYPHPGESLAGWQIVLSALVLLAITAVVLIRREKRYLAMGWFWFLGTLVPVIGLVQVGDQAMADRYAYIPLVGIFVMIAFGVADLADAKKLGFKPRLIAGACILAALSFLTYRQLGYWSSSYELWSHTLAITQNNFVAEDNMGGALLLLDKPDEAHTHFEAAARINPHDPMSHSNLGVYLQEHNQLRGAVEEYRSAIQMTSDPALLASTYANLGAAYRDLGDDAKARESYDESLRMNPDQFNAYLGLGRLLERQGKLDEAIANYSRSVQIRPTESGFLRLGHAAEMKGRRQDAISAYQQALQLNPDSSEAQQALKALSASPQ